MPRNMSFALTMKQINDRSKTITRRLGWWFLKVGDEVNAVNKVMGFKKGERHLHKPPAQPPDAGPYDY